MVHKNTEGKLDMGILRETAEKCKNWGKWGPDDEAGTLNYIGADEIIAAAGLIRKGKTFSLGLNFDNKGPQSGLWGNRFNPIHTMLATGTDALSGNQDEGGIRYADDMVSLPLQCGTQWDALGHIFYDDKMWNGYDAGLVDSNGAQKNGIEKVKDKMVGRGVLLDIAKHVGVEALSVGDAISRSDLDACAEAQGVEVKKGDLLRHLGLRSPTERDHGCATALALGCDSDDRHHHGRNFRHGRTVRRLRTGRRVGILLLRTAAAGHRRGWLADQPDCNQVAL